MKKIDRSKIAAYWVVFSPVFLSLLAASGWIANIVKLAHMDLTSMTGLLIVRAIGICVPPLGIVLGFF